MEEEHVQELDTSSESLAKQFGNIHALLYEERYDEVLSLLTEMHSADFADFLDHTTIDVHKLLIPRMINDFNADTLVWLSPHTLLSIVNIIGHTTIARLINELETEDSIEIIDQLDDTTKTEVINNLPEKKRLHILEGFAYAEHTAGRVMEKNFVYFYDYWTVGDAMEYMRTAASLPDNFHAAIVVDAKFRPVGTVMLSNIVVHPKHKHIRDLITEDFKVTEAHTDLTEISYVFRQYALTIIPVVSKTGKLLGTISINNIVYIMQEQAEEAFLHLGGVNEIDTFQGVLITSFQRFPWLFVNLITACLTSSIIGSFQDTIGKVVALASIMPIVASMGGNAGTQTMTVTVRAIANKETTKTHVVRMIVKELMTCLLNGLLLSIIGSSVIFAVLGNVYLSYVFCISVISTFVVAGIFGSSVPIFFNYFKIDPAPASGVVLTAITDSVGFFTFLGVAHLML